jgi:hypothetical protein
MLKTVYAWISRLNDLTAEDSDMLEHARVCIARRIDKTDLAFATENLTSDQIHVVLALLKTAHIGDPE